MLSRPGAALSFLFLLLALPAAAQQGRQDALAGDLRLTRIVTIQAEGLAVGDLLDLLSQKTGVSLTATKETAGDKVLLFTPARPLRDTLADLAALFDDRWTRKKAADGSATYVLTRDLRARQYEAQLARAATERAMTELEEQVRALAETPEQLARRPEKDRIRRFLSEPVARLGTRFYAALGAQQREALFERRQLNVPFSSLSPQHQAPLRRAWAERMAMEQEIIRNLQAQDPSQRVRANHPEDLERGSLRYRVQRVGGFLSIGMGLGVLPFAAEVKQDENGHGSYSFSGWPIALLDGRAGWLPPHGNPYTGEPVPADASLPAAGTVRTAATGKEWPEQLRRLAASSATTVLADYYRGKPVARPPDDAASPAPPETAAAALDALCRPVGYLWWVRGQTMLLRKRDWYEQRRYEVPDPWLLDIAARLEDHPVPTRADALRVLDLTTEQLAGLSALASGDYVYDDDVLSSVHQLLAILNSAPVGNLAPLPTEARSAETQKRITVSYQGLTPLQRSLLPAFLKSLDHEVSPREIAGFQVRLFCPSANPPAGGSGYRSVPVRVEWSLGSERVPQGVSVFLPASLPGVHRATAEVRS